MKVLSPLFNFETNISSGRTQTQPYEIWKKQVGRVLRFA